MWARTQLKIGWADLAFGAVSCVKRQDRDALQRRIEADWSPAADALACLSVRSGFDLLLQALKLDPGSEIVFSALNIKGMVKIVSRHGFVPVPVDVDFETMGPRLDSLERAITPRTRMIVVAHLFGARLDLHPIVALARQHNILFVEDCAQIFDGAYRGHPDADVCMFSFGPLKTATALGGGILQVRDPGLLAAMRLIQDTYPVQGERAYLNRVAKFAALKVITAPFVFGLLYRAFRALGKDYEDPVSDAVRNVAQLGSSKKIRQRPSASMLAVLERRLKTFDTGEFAERGRIGHTMLRLLGGAVRCPGTRNPVHTYWIFPIVSREPKKLIADLRAAGFDACDLPRSQAVEAPDSRPDLDPTIARDTLQHLVVLPCYPGMPAGEIERQAEIVKRAIAHERAEDQPYRAAVAAAE